MGRHSDHRATSSMIQSIFLLIVLLILASFVGLAVASFVDAAFTGLLP